MATNYNYFGGIVTNGLVLDLDAAKLSSYPAGGTAWIDISGNGNNGVLTNGPTFSGVGKQASIVFDGVDDYVTGSLSNFNVGCISMWINPSTLINSGSSFQSILTLKYTGTVDSEWYIALGSATSFLVNEYISVLDVQNSTRTAIADGGSLLANSWYNLVFNLESGTYKIYVNNIKKTETTFGGGVQQLTVPNMLQLGALVRLGVVAGPFPGKISLVQLYNRSLSTSEITQNFNALRGRYSI